jgi:HemK-related putative methylase
LVEYDFPKYKIMLDIDEDIYFPAEDTFALIDAIQLDTHHRFVVELGGGSGIITVVLAKRYPNIKFLVTDISFKATKTIAKNIKLNEIKNQIDLICMDKLEATSHLNPDVIIWNPPYLPIDDQTDNLKALEKLMLIGGNKGIEQTHQLIQYLNSQNRSVVLYTIFSSVGVSENTFNQIRKEGIEIEICDEISLFFEKLYLVKVKIGETNG